MYCSLPFSNHLKIAIAGRSKDTVNYERALREMGATCLTTMDSGGLSDFDALLLPGGGDITPAFFGQKNLGSRNIDIELDITQLQALELFVKWQRPVLGICKGMQIINVFFGGTICQHIEESDRHAWNEADQLHPTFITPGSCLADTYGTSITTNSAHHQAIDQIGGSLRVIQRADDGIIEGIVHNSLPILGVQWHPERMFRPVPDPGMANGRLLFSYFLTLCAHAALPSPALR